MSRFDWPYSETDVLAFAHAVVRGGFRWQDDSEDRLHAIIDLIDEAYKWKPELDAWVAAGCPESFDVSDLTAANDESIVLSCR
jgi:hypothetical protein